MSKVVHFEVPVDDPERASRFYREVLGWEVVANEDQPYWLVRAGGDDEAGANGALTLRGDLHRSPILVAGVADIDSALAAVDDSGGLVLQGKEPVPGVGWSAYIRDPEGNTLGFFQPDPGAAGEASRRAEVRLDEVEDESFPASDSHADWAGPPS